MQSISPHSKQKRKSFAGLPVPTAILYGIFFAVAFAAYTALWRQAPVMSSDSWGYLATASDMADFRLDHLAYRPPGYPLLVLITGSNEVPHRSLFFVSLLLHFASVWILAGVLYSVGLETAALTPFGLLLLLPPYVEAAGYVLSENLAEFMLVVGFGSFVCWALGTGDRKWLFISGMAIGCAALTRPAYQALSLAMAASLFIVRDVLGWPLATRMHTIKASLILVCTSASLICGYGFYNYVKFDHFGLSLTTPVDSGTLSTRTARVVERLPDNPALRDVLVRARDAALVQQGSHTGAGYLSSPGVVEELSRVTGLQGPQLASYLLHVNLQLIRAAPLEYLTDVARAFATFWFPSNGVLANMGSRVLQLLWGVIHFLTIGLFAVMVVMVIGGLPYIGLCKRYLPASDAAILQELHSTQLQGTVYLFAGAVVAYAALASSVFETGDPRYRVPTDGLIVLMAVLGADFYRRSRRSVRMSLMTRDRVA